MGWGWYERGGGMGWWAHPLGLGKSTGGVSTISAGRGGRYGVGLVPEGWGDRLVGPRPE
jgi:hypothetical protein